MITIDFETANLVETPLADDGNGRRAWLGPGTRALVHLTLRNSEKRVATKTISISGADGGIFYDGQPTGDYARGGGYTLRQPFWAGERAVVELEPDRLSSITYFDTVIIGHDGRDPWGGGPEWFLKRVVVVVASVGYEFACNRWLWGPDVTLSSPSLASPVDSAIKPAVFHPIPPQVLPGGVFGPSRFSQASFV